MYESPARRAAVEMIHTDPGIMTHQVLLTRIDCALWLTPQHLFSSVY